MNPTTWLLVVMTIAGGTVREQPSLKACVSAAQALTTPRIRETLCMSVDRNRTYAATNPRG